MFSVDHKIMWSENFPLNHCYGMNGSKRLIEKTTRKKKQAMIECYSKVY